MAIVVGGETVALENGKIEMPPEQAKNTQEILNNIEKGNFQEIKVGNCRAEEILSKKQLEILKANRKERRTKKALERRVNALGR